MPTQAFIIMQIGHPVLDAMCREAIVPALKSCGLNPKRVDKHNQGGLLKSEIIRFIESSDIIVADLTNERPNCYLEIGYAMGVDKFKNLILTARHDHNPDSPHHKPGGPRIHFDLAGYDILFWDPSNLAEFSKELTKRVQRRLAIITTQAAGAPLPWDGDWIDGQRSLAKEGHARVGLPGSFEFRLALPHPKPQFEHQQLRDASERAQIHTFGWPLGIVLDKPQYLPRPRADGISAEVEIKTFKMLSYTKSSYDYWSLRRNGDFYLLKTLYEDERHPDEPRVLFFNTRIVRITEVFLYCARLYGTLGVDPTTQVSVAIRHSALRGRVLSSSNPARSVWAKQPSEEDVSETILSSPLGAIESDLVDLVKQVARPLLVLFEFFELSDPVYEQIVNDYVAGKTT